MISAGNWYLELRESGTKTIAFFKERLDSLLSYQKKLNEILTTCEAPEIRIRAIAELHRIEMSLHTIFQELPHDQFQFRPEIEQETKHCYCHSCLPGFGGEGAGPLVEQPERLAQSLSNSTRPTPSQETITPYRSLIKEPLPDEEEEQEQIIESKLLISQDEPEEEEEEPEETEADRYWRTHPSRVRPINNK